MPRYIDAEAVKLNVRRYLIPNTDDYGTVRVEDAERWFLKLIDECPTADVAPKSEVEKAVVGDIEKHLQYQRKKVDIPFTSRDMRNYQCGAIDVIEYFEELVADLKKKYTEGENNG